ncbi:hypothetical protein Tco_1263408 [Tanacetum coccineum]
MAISSSSSSSSSDKEVQNCSKQCLESFKTLQKNFDSEREKHSRARLEIQGYELALESLESRILGHEKNELAWGKKYKFQNYELKCREVKLDNLKMELEKDIKERDELKVRSSDEEITPANDRFSKADGYHAVPPPITGASLDEYVIRKKIIESKTDTSKSKTSETVDDEDDVSAVKTVSSVKTNETRTVRNQVDKIRVLTRTGLVNPVRPNWKRAVHTVSTARPISTARPVSTASILQDHAVVDSGCSSHMTGNKAYLSDYKDYNGGFVAFGSDPKGGKSAGYFVVQLRATYGAELVSAASLVNTARPTLSTARLSLCCSKVLHDGNDVWIGVLALESIKDAQAAEISALKSRIKKLEKKFGKKESISKQGRKKSKPESTLDDSTVFDNQDADHGMEYMETEEAVDEGRQSGKTKEVKLIDDTEVVEDKSNGDKGGNAEELISTARPEVSTARPNIDVAMQEDSVVEPRTPPTTTSIFYDEDITMAQTLIKMKEEKAKEKGVSIKDVDDSSRPARSILTLKPLPTIDPKDKGKGVLKESPIKKVKRSDLDAAQIAKDAEIARLVHEKELAEMEREREERQRHDQASVDYIASLYDEVQAKMDASEERKKLLAEERAAAVRNKPPTRTQLRSLMMTYLKHTDFVPIGSERDEKMIDKMNKKAAGMDEEEVPEEPESTKVEVKQEGHKENIRKRSGRRLKMKAIKKSKRQKTGSDLKEEEQLRASLKIVPGEEEEIDYEVLSTRYLIVNWESTFYHTDRYGVPHDYYRVFRANRSSRYIKTFTEMVSRFDRLDFIELHSLVMQRFSTTTPEGIDLVLWGDLRTIVHILALEDGTEIHMLTERRYPLIRETLERMMELRLTAESEVRKIFKCWFSDHTTNGHQFTMSNRHQELASPEANRFCAPCYSNEALAIPKQTAIGKEISNPFMAGSLPKTT